MSLLPLVKRDAQAIADWPDDMYVQITENSWGRAVRTRDGVAPVFVSSGHRLSLRTAVKWVLATGRGFRLPEPTRQAHLAVNRLRAESAAGAKRDGARGKGT